MQTLALGGAMHLLKSLKLVHYEHPIHRNPHLHRRHKLVAKLAEQIQLAQDSAYKPTKIQYVADGDGNLTPVQRSKRPSLVEYQNG